MEGMSPPQSSSSALSPSMDSMLSKSGGMHPIGTGEHVPLDNHSSNGGSPIHNGISEENSHDADSSLDGSLMDTGFPSPNNDPEMPKLTAS